MNVELLLRVKAKILEEPAQFVMGSVWANRDSWACHFPLWDIPREIPNCGTAACIAGWAAVLDAGAKPSDLEHQPGWALGQKALDLISMDEADRLFETGHWPREFWERWHASKDLSERAEIAAERIDHFIATEGRE